MVGHVDDGNSVVANAHDLGPFELWLFVEGYPLYLGAFLKVGHVDATHGDGTRCALTRGVDGEVLDVHDVLTAGAHDAVARFEHFGETAAGKSQDLSEELLDPSFAQLTDTLEHVDLANDADVLHVERMRILAKHAQIRSVIFGTPKVAQCRCIKGHITLYTAHGSNGRGTGDGQQRV